MLLFFRANLKVFPFFRNLQITDFTPGYQKNFNILTTAAAASKHCEPLDGLLSTIALIGRTSRGLQRPWEIEGLTLSSVA